MSRCGCTALGCTCRVDDLDTDCINTHVTGTGTSDDPYLISADPVVDPDGCLVCGGNGLAVEVDPNSCLACGPNGMTVDVDPNGCLVCGPNGLTVEVNPSLENQLVCVPGEGLFVPPVTGLGGGGGPYIVVAASDTSPERQAIANYVCDGIADDVEINQAVDDLTPVGFQWGGTVYLLEGSYYTAAPIDLKYGGVNLEGVGWNATYIYFDGNGDAGARTGIGNPYGDDYVITKVGDGSHVSDLYIATGNDSGTGYRGGINLAGNYSLATRVFIELGSDPLTQPIQNSAIRMNYGSIVKDSRIEAYAGTAIDGGSDQDYMRIENNFIGGSIGFDGDGTEYLHIVNNYFDGGDDVGATIYDYSLYPYVYGTGILIWAGGDDPTIISGNTVYGFRGSGILLEEAANVSVLGNTVWQCSYLSTDGYSGIWVKEGCYGVNVQNNMVRGEYHKYGLEVGATVNPNFATLAANNDLLDSGNTGPYFDAGTGTEILGGNRLA